MRCVTILWLQIGAGLGMALFLLGYGLLHFGTWESTLALAGGLGWVFLVGETASRALERLGEEASDDRA